ncbi:rab-GTPase-TBC domain-containing protein, partial [Baffinella frigidus]
MLPRTVVLLRTGLPATARDAAWPLAIGNALNLSSGDYALHLRTARRVRAEWGWRRKAAASAGIPGPRPEDGGAWAAGQAGQEEEAGLVRDLDQVSLDVCRTLPETGHFGDDGPLHGALGRVLDAHAAFSRRRAAHRHAHPEQKQILPVLEHKLQPPLPPVHPSPGGPQLVGAGGGEGGGGAQGGGGAHGASSQLGAGQAAGRREHGQALVGYVQGQSLLAGMLLLHVREEEAFVCLENLLEMHHLPDFFSLDPRRILAYSRAFGVFLARHLPRLSARLRALAIDPTLFLLPWWLTMLAGTAPLGVASRVWDRCLLEGLGPLVSITLALLSAIAGVLLECDFGDTLAILTRLDRAGVLEGERQQEAVLHAASVSVRVSSPE